MASFNAAEFRSQIGKLQILIAAKQNIHFNFSEIAWKNENSNEGFTIPWAKIVVTAISQDPMRCIYFMIDSEWTEDDQPVDGSNGTDTNGGTNDDEDVEGSETESEHAITEFWLDLIH